MTDSPTISLEVHDEWRVVVAFGEGVRRNGCNSQSQVGVWCEELLCNPQEEEEEEVED